MTSTTHAAHADIVDLREAAERFQELRAHVDCDMGLTADESAELTLLTELTEAFKNDIGALLEEYAEDEPTLIRESHWEDYAQSLAEELGRLDDAMEWPFTCIDWAQAAAELAYDYSQVRWAGATWYVRSI